MSAEGTNINRLLGELTASVKSIERSLSDHKNETREEFRDAAEKRKLVYEKMDDQGRKIAAVDTKLSEYEPDLRRCRMIRHFGIIGAAIVSFGASLAFAWDGIWKILHIRG